MKQFFSTLMLVCALGFSGATFAEDAAAPAAEGEAAAPAAAEVVQNL